MRGAVAPAKLAFDAPTPNGWRRGGAVRRTGLERQLAAAVTLRDQVEYVQLAEMAGLLQELVPVIRRLLNDVTPQFMETVEHVRRRAASAKGPNKTMHHRRASDSDVVGIGRAGDRRAFAGLLARRNCATRCWR